MGPTTNYEYNQIVKEFNDKNFPNEMRPECELCGADCTGKAIIKIGPVFCCKKCKDDGVYYLTDDCFEADYE